MSGVHHAHRDVSDEGPSSRRSEKISANKDDYIEDRVISVVHKKWDDRSFRRVKLICSYGGRILPRPHDNNQLRYVGGDTHVLVVSRNVTFSELTKKLSKTLGAHAAVLVKYQLPYEDLDTLISVSSEEDLENMMEEYDRLEASSGSRARLRLFLFPSRLERSYTVGLSSAIDDQSRERWFVDALNNSSYYTPPLARVQSEISSTVWEVAPDFLGFGTDMDALEEWAAAAAGYGNTSVKEQTPTIDKVVDSGTGASSPTTLFGSLVQLHHAVAAVGSMDGPISPLKRNPVQQQQLVGAAFSSSSSPAAIIASLSTEAACSAASERPQKPAGSYEDEGIVATQHPTSASPSRFGASAGRP